MKKFLTILLLGIVASNVSAQNFGDLNTQVQYPTSPNSASLGQYGEFPVSLQNGGIDIAIPLESVKGASLSVPIILSYHASGIKVDEQASWVGLGWNLNIGGAITRKVVGIPDEGTNGFFYTRGSIKDAANIEWLDDNEWQDIRGAFMGNNDYEPDIFYFSMPGYSGSFRLGNDDIFYSESLDNVKIERFDYAFRTFFEITTSDGTLYRFGRDLDDNEVVEKSRTDPNRYNNGNSYYTEAISTWYLTEIVSPSKDDIVYFKYFNQIQQSDLVVTNQSASVRFGYNTGLPSPVINYNTLATHYLRDSRELSEVIFTNGKLVFNTEDDRVDHLFNRLNSIDIYDLLDGVYTKRKTIRFLNNNKYFDRPSGTIVDTRSFDNIKNKKSLKLEGIVIESAYNEISNRYSFEYNTEELPARETTSQDYWGYYNGKNNGDLIPKKEHDLGQIRIFGDADRSPNEVYMKAGILEKIVFPTGGATVFDFESHYYLDETEEGVKGQMKEKTINVAATAVGIVTDPAVSAKTKLVDEVLFTAVKSEMVNLVWDFSNIIENLDIVGYPKIELLELDPNTGDILSHIPFSKVYHGTNDPLNGTQLVSLRKDVTYVLRAETCSCTSTSIIEASLASTSLHYTDYYYETNPDLIQPYMAGGLRIKSIKSYKTHSDSNPLIKTYVYGDNQYSDIGTGYLLSRKTSTYEKTDFRFAAYSKDVNLDCNPLSFYLTPAVLTVSSNSLVEFGLNRGAPVEYSKVTEYLGTKDNNNGKIEYHYERTQADIGFFGGEVKGGFDFIIYPKYMSGILNKKITFKNTNGVYEVVQKQDFTYATLKTASINSMKILSKDVNEIVRIKSGFYQDQFECAREYLLMPLNYSVTIGKRVLSVNKTETYDKLNDNWISQTKHLKYDTDYFQVIEEKILTGEGGEFTTHFSYPDDRIAISGLSTESLEALMAMEELGWTGEIIEKKQFNGLTPIKSIRKDYILITANEISQNNVLQSLGATPYKNIINFEQYSSGKLLQYYRDIEGIRYAVLWGVNESRPVVKGVNVDYATLKMAADIAIKEISGYSNGIDDLDRLLNDIKYLDNDMKRSIWKSFNDGIREQLPVNVITTTYTYDPLLGITSQTDLNGNTTYFTYDNFGRLKQVKDHNNNLIESWEYHYYNEN
jgi:hypothetical protein